MTAIAQAVFPSASVQKAEIRFIAEADIDASRGQFINPKLAKDHAMFSRSCRLNSDRMGRAASDIECNHGELATIRPDYAQAVLARSCDLNSFKEMVRSAEDDRESRSGMWEKLRLDHAHAILANSWAKHAVMRRIAASESALNRGSLAHSRTARDQKILER